MENQDGEAVPQSASLSINNDELSKTPMSEQNNIGDKGLDDQAAEGQEKVDDVAKDHEGNSAASVSFGAWQEPESSDGKQQGAKRKRGRPRKGQEATRHVVFRSSSVETGLQTNPPANSGKRRGRPPGTGRLQLLASCGGVVAESAGGIFTTHVIRLNPGDDVVNTIKHLSGTRRRRALVILSASGSLSNVSISAAGGFLQCEGIFEVIKLNGSFVNGGTGDPKNIVGSLSIIFTRPNGDLVGGRVEGRMIAATPITIIAGSFEQNIFNKLRRKNPAESSSVGQENPMPLQPLLQQSTPPENITENAVQE